MTPRPTTVGSTR